MHDNQNFTTNFSSLFIVRFIEYVVYIKYYGYRDYNREILLNNFAICGYDGDDTWFLLTLELRAFNFIIIFIILTVFVRI